MKRLLDVLHIDLQAPQQYICGKCNNLYLCRDCKTYCCGCVIVGIHADRCRKCEDERNVWPDLWKGLTLLGILCRWWCT